jgi:aryl-alcohol dehydrogenase (NADP+)
MGEADVAMPVLKRAWDLGINFFDTANVYSRGRSEEILGEFLKDIRNDAVVATKVNGVMKEVPNGGGLSRKHVIWQCGESLRRLKTDRIDLYQIHRWDYETPIEETLCTLTDLVRSGRVLYIGASSMWARQLAKALWVSDVKGYERFVSMQNLYNLLYREEEREMIPLCLSEGIGLIPWSPTAVGVLSGEYLRNDKLATTQDDHPRLVPSSMAHKSYIEPPQNEEIVRRVVEVSKREGVKPVQIALAWLFRKGVTSPIIGTRKVSHLEDAVGAVDVKITDDEMKYLEETYRPVPVRGHT